VADAPVIARLNRDAQRLHAEAHGQLFKPAGAGDEIAAWFAAALEKPDTHALIGTVDGEAIGYICGQIARYQENPFRYASAIGLVDHLSISPAFQRRGYGDALLDALLAIFRDAGVARIELSVWAFNENARRFYERRGFVMAQQRMNLALGEADLLA